MSQNPIQEAIHLLFAGQNLTTEQADAAMTQIMEGEATPAQIGAFLAALRMKGETVEEITGCASAMRRSAVQVRPAIGDAKLVDIVGTGGDGTYKFNISTIAAFVIAGAGVKVAKHGNRSNKRAGSADVLEALGATLQLTADQAAECIEEVGIAFLFAPAYHPAMRHAIGPRRELAARTVFNILGPLTNPAPTTHQLIGVYSLDLTDLMANVLAKMGSKAAYVVHGFYETGAGLDELTTTGPSHVSHLQNGQVRSFEFDPKELGFGRATLADLQGGDAAANAEIARGILCGEIHGPKRDVVLLNAAAALSTDTGNLDEGMRLAQESLDTGAALHTLERYIAKTRSYA
ncbi:MAG TPA: anthranilate phosphoribosyltransferase [Caldilineaceae bacterium]|nr:anthranilate phosphoribosyltransferase [Caldilineaceae bacterium]